ncbi:thiamine phosphate synthase [Acidicapsa ligni]|uniref:thiamine phosphate synthase n=1 Tax=Acidicapsa ligni TaxID=542300 RepID=UPI0021E0130B|nr:thiamine phosphate synthase [Acidicapsa ligni]
MRDWLPKVYPILDSSIIPFVDRAVFLDRLGRSLAGAEVRLLEYRNKNGTDAEVLADARVLRAAMPETKLILDDRVDITLAAGFDGTHVDAGDIPIADARLLLGPQRIVGTSAGTSASGESGARAAVAEGANYVSFGPVFTTTTKQTSAPTIGIEGVRRFREFSGSEPVLVAAAGITLDTAPAILEAGADAVAVAAALFRNDDPAKEFLRWMAILR